MKYPILLLVFNLTAADLGVISPRHGILLDHQTTRTDFQKFEVELKHRDTTNVVTLTLTNNLLLHSDLVQLPSGRTTMGLKSYFWDGSVSDIAIYTFDLRRAAPPAPSAVRSILRAGGEPPKSLISELERRYLAQAMPPPPVPSRGHTLTNDHPWAPILPSTNGLDMETGLPTTEILIRPLTNDTELARPLRVWQMPSFTNSVNVPTLIKSLEYHTGSNVVFVPKPMPGATNRTYGEHLDWIEDRKGKRRNE